jgi:N-acetylneuraminic acid mutarotase
LITGNFFPILFYKIGIMKKVYFSLFLSGTLSSVTAQWTMPSPMYETRSEHVAVTLNSGEVLVAGGWDFTIHLISAEVYNPLADTWTVTGNDMFSAHSTGAAVKLSDGKVLVTGGYNGTMNVTASDLFNPLTNQWSVAAPLLAARSYHTATLLTDGRVLVTGGYDGTTNLAECELYNPTTNSWSSADSLNTGRAYHTATLLNDGKVLVTGGYNPAAGFQLSSAELYDPATNTWTSVPDMEDARAWHSASLLTDGRVMVAGGEHFVGTSPYAYEGLKTAEVYDPVTNNWDDVADMPGGLCYNQQHTLSGKVIVLAGHSNTDYGSGFVAAPGVTYVYDISGDSWTAAPMSIDGRHEFASTKMSDGRILVTGGNDNSAEIFDQFLSVSEIGKETQNLQVMANGNGNFTVYLSGQKKMENLVVYDLSGKTVFTQNNLNASSALLNLGAVSEGVYTIKVSTGTGIMTKKIGLVK